MGWRGGGGGGTLVVMCSVFSTQPLMIELRSRFVSVWFVSIMGNRALNGGPHSSLYSDVMLWADPILDCSVLLA